MTKKKQYVLRNGKTNRPSADKMNKHGMNANTGGQMPKWK